MAGGHAEATRLNSAGRSWAGSGRKLLCGPRLAGPGGGRAGPRARRHCLRSGRPRPGRGGPREARAAGAGGRKGVASGLGAAAPQARGEAAWDGGTGRDGGCMVGAPHGALPCAPDPRGRCGAPVAHSWTVLSDGGDSGGWGGGCGQGRASRAARSWGPPPWRVGAQAPLELRVLLLRLGPRRARQAGRAAVPDTPKSQASAAARRTEDLPPPPLSFFGSVSGPATRRWGLRPSLRARELAARQRWKRDKSGTVCRRKFLMQLSAFADCLSKRLPGDGLQHVRYGN